MGRRLSGLLLILRALAPVLIVLIVGGTLAVVLTDVRAAVDEPLKSIRTEIFEVRTTVDEVRDDIDTVSEQVTELVDVLGDFSIPNLIPNIPASLSFPSLSLPSVSIPVPTVSMKTSTTKIAGVSLTYPSGLNVGSTSYSLNIPSIPSFPVPLPGLGQVDDVLRNALSGVTSVFDTFDSAFASVGELVTSLGQVPDHMTTIASQSEQLARNIQDVVGRWQETLLIVVIILLILIVIYLGAPVLDDLTRGWAMLRGLPPDGV